MSPSALNGPSSLAIFTNVTALTCYVAAASVELLESPDKNQYVLGGYYKKRKERGFQSETNPSTARIYSAMK